MTPKSGDSLVNLPLIINGKEVETTKHFPVISPGTAKIIWNGPAATREQAVSAVEAASSAFRTWSNTGVEQRRQILLKAADLVESRVEELAGYMNDETAADGHFAAMTIQGSAHLLREIAGRITSALTGSVPIFSEGSQAIIVKEPYGVVLAIAPW
jgi:acyl-CoA reductase-like NAD-dependent aldehyde dehydrogenase